MPHGPAARSCLVDSSGLYNNCILFKKKKKRKKPSAERPSGGAGSFARRLCLNADQGPLLVLILLSCSQHLEPLLLFQHHLSPSLLKTLSERSVGLASSFSYLKQFSAELVTEAEFVLTLLIKLVNGEAEAGETRPG